ncbi:GNAT family protein [Paenibacillus sp. MMS20-IR301]|uniref:GNAT family N-acetyltransferase n=1 Tax=Paenibacillus sp. MMS20-IR301 TaxID=2895946 RepID=UPI0028EF23DE|nr:GNAT family protein [Paenibacillus sp. MMS20-IR301]WNS46877.1 GNAT family protein [Paenibacillus sp. MMS20-IR301]
MDTQQLEGSVVTLVPLKEEHRPELVKLLIDPLIWEYTWRKISTSQQAHQLIDTAMVNQAMGTDIPYAVIDRASGRIAGSTRIMHLDYTHRNAEIGGTWISPEYWRTPVNTESKSLLLHHCFEDLNLIRVNFSIVSDNLRSQRAIERIGAVREGILRKQRLTAGGAALDNALYSIIDDEWPAVKDNLHYLLNVKYK